MNRLDIQEQPPIPGGNGAVHQLKYDRTTFDYIIIAAAYLLMPVGLILALIRLIGTNYKNYRKPSNYNLMVHVFIGGFFELVVALFGTALGGDIERSDLLITLIVTGIMFLIPILILANMTARAKFSFSKLSTSYIELIQNNHIRHIGSLSERLGQSERDVRRDVQYLKDKGLLDINIEFSEGRQMSEPLVTAPNLVHQARVSAQQNHTQPQSSPQLPKSIRCPGCGAQNMVIPGHSKDCEYCGTTIPYS